jgi:diguanylate cyclase (GGDEF)-like protein
MMGSTKQILLISDDKNYDVYLHNLLQNQEGINFEINQVHSVEKALGEIHSKDYDSIILDISAGENCITAAERICSVSAHIPLIVLTHSENKFSINAIKNNVQQIVRKDYLDSQMITQTILLAIERKNIENEIRMRDEILEAVNNAAEIFLTQSDWRSYLNEVLASLGNATRSDRVYVFSNIKDQDGSLRGEFKAEWVNETVHVTKTATVAEGVNYVRAGFGRWVDIMQAGGVVHGDVEDLPSQEQPLLMKLGVKSLIYVPIFIDHTWWGFIGFDQCAHHNKWLQVEVDALRTAAKILGAAISRQVTEEKLIYLATHDYLTDLPNRLLFEDRFRQAQARSERSSKNFAIISIDLDRFKIVNDTHGHLLGDGVLIEVAKRLTMAVRGTDTCARIGGDEFAILAEEIQNKGDVLRVMEKVSSAFQEKIELEEKEIQISASMGASIFPIHGNSLEDLMKAADKTLYLIKGTSTRYKIFSDDQISWLKK